MSLTSVDNTNNLKSSVLSGASTDKTLLWTVWAKLASAGSGASQPIVDWWRTTNAGTRMLGMQHTNNNFRSVISSSTTSKVDDSTNSTLSGLWDAWHNFIMILEGPQGGGSVAWEVRIDDSIWDSGTFTSVNITETMAALSVGLTWSATTGNSGNKFGQLGIGSFDSLTDARTAATALQTAAPASVTGMVAAWPMISDRLATLGGTNLSANGTPVFDAADNPTLGGGGGGGGGQVIVADSTSGAMHRETPQQQARRLGFSGWRAATELRRAA